MRAKGRPPLFHLLDAPEHHRGQGKKVEPAGSHDLWIFDEPLAFARYFSSDVEFSAPSEAADMIEEQNGRTVGAWSASATTAFIARYSASEGMTYLEGHLIATTYSSARRTPPTRFSSAPSKSGLHAPGRRQRQNAVQPRKAITGAFQLRIDQARLGTWSIRLARSQQDRVTSNARCQIAVFESHRVKWRTVENETANTYVIELTL